eukprot:COSAG05_NODE_5977_length_1047_cov_1.044304_2_plen_26_part_01
MQFMRARALLNPVSAHTTEAEPQTMT